MQQQARHDEVRSPSSQHSRSNSFSSDAAQSLRPSMTSTIPRLKPPPAYVALAAASQLATDNQKGRMQDELYDLSNSAPPEDDGALFSERALEMINAFLDHLLYSFIASAGSPSLSSLRTAVEQVLKGKLARLAIGSAEEELQELLAEGEDEELALAQHEADGSAKNNVEMIFKRTRLRIMVYTRLGEMEEEEEEACLEEEGLLSEGPTRKRVSEIPGLVSWAATIFLTSILEYIGEQCIDVASQATYGRIALRRANASSPIIGIRGGVDGERAIIEEHDVERIALNSTLGRLWRTWRKNLRTPRMHVLPSPQSRSVSARTSTSTLRPGSPVGPGRDGQVVVGMADVRPVPRQVGQAASVPQSQEEGRPLAKQPRPGYSAEDEIENSRRRARAIYNLASSSDAHSANLNGYLTPERSPDTSHHRTSRDEPGWQDVRARNARPQSYRTSSESGSALGARESPRFEGDHAVVPISGVLHLHLPANGSAGTALGRSAIPEATVARFDYATSTSQANRQQPQVVETDIHRRNTLNEVGKAGDVENGVEGIHEESQAGSNDSAYAGQQSWMPDVSNVYQSNSANKVAPLRVRIPADDAWNEGHDLPSNGIMRTNGANAGSSVRQGPYQPAKVLKTVTARSITPSSDSQSRQSSDLPRSEALSSARPTSPQLLARPPVANLTPSREGYLPREPRIQTESTRDLTDFIRSTAPNPDQARVAPIMTLTTLSPDGSDKLPPPLSSHPYPASMMQSDNLDVATGPATPKARSQREPSVTNTDRSELIQEVKSGHPVVSPPPRHKSTRVILEPRDPVVRGRSNDDLIAFLRQGPPGADVSRPTPRESLERRTADKFAMAGAANRTSELTLNPPSMSESVNSHSALLPKSSLNNSSTEQPRYSTDRLTGAETLVSQGAMRPKRRIKDPYAIDTDDEDDDVLTALPKKERGEESLIDFLNTTGPTASEDPVNTRATDGRNSPAAGVSFRSHTLQKLRPVSPINEKTVSSPPRTPSNMISTPAFGASVKSPTTPELGEFLSGASTPIDLRPKADAMTAKYNNFDHVAPSPSTNRTKDMKTKAESRGVRGLFRKISSGG